MKNVITSLLFFMTIACLILSAYGLSFVGFQYDHTWVMIGQISMVFAFICWSVAFVLLVKD